MRYLSQLVRETTARMMPSREPSWLRPIPQLVQESIIEWTATPSEEPRSGLDHVAPAPDQNAERATQESPQCAMANETFKTAGVLAHSRSSNPPQVQGEEDPFGGASRTHSIRTRDWEHANRASSNGLPASVPPVRQEPIELRRSPRLAPADPALERRIEPAAAAGEKLPATLQSVVTEVASRQQELELRYRSDQSSASKDYSRLEGPSAGGEPPATLQSVLTEIARRQQELELRYRSEQSPARKDLSRPGEASTEGRSPRESDELRLNIGSIVVQVEPEQAATVPPRPAPRRAPRESNSRWARSFLDR